jgi:hypothetical protein
MVVNHVEGEASGPRWVEAESAMAGAVRAGGLWRGVEALAEVVSASTGLDNAKLTDVFCQATSSSASIYDHRSRSTDRPRSRLKVSGHAADRSLVSSLTAERAPCHRSVGLHYRDSRVSVSMAQRIAEAQSSAM